MAGKLRYSPEAPVELGIYFQTELNRLPGSNAATLTDDEIDLITDLRVNGAKLGFYGKYFLDADRGYLREQPKMAMLLNRIPDVLNQNVFSGKFSIYSLVKVQICSEDEYERFICMAVGEVNIIGGDDQDRFFDPIPPPAVVHIPVTDVNAIMPQ